MRNADDSSRSRRWRSRSSLTPTSASSPTSASTPGTWRPARGCSTSAAGDRAHRAGTDDARQRARGGRRGLCGRHRRGGGHQAGDHRRHAGRARRSSPAGEHHLPRAGDQGCRRAQDQGRPEKMSVALGRLAEEDPTFQVRTNEETGQTEISGMGELHLEVLVDRMCGSSASTRTSVARRCPIARLCATRVVRWKGGSCVRPAARVSTASSSSTWSPRPAWASSSSTRSRAETYPRKNHPGPRRANPPLRRVGAEGMGGARGRREQRRDRAAQRRQHAHQHRQPWPTALERERGRDRRQQPERECQPTGEQVRRGRRAEPHGAEPCALAEVPAREWLEQRGGPA